MTYKQYNKGGKGTKAPYKTKMRRIPVEIEELVENIAIAYKDKMNRHEEPKPLLEAIQKAIRVTTIEHSGHSEEVKKEIIGMLK